MNVKFSSIAVKLEPNDRINKALICLSEKRRINVILNLNQNVYIHSIHYEQDVILRNFSVRGKLI